MDVTESPVGDVTSVLFSFAAALDRQDLAALRPLMTEDARLTRADGTHHGREAVAATLARWIATGVKSSQHNITNTVLERSDDASEITARSNFLVTVFYDDRTQLLVGNYIDTLRRDRSGWRLAHKWAHVQRTLVLSASDAHDPPPDGDASPSRSRPLGPGGVSKRAAE